MLRSCVVVLLVFVCGGLAYSSFNALRADLNYYKAKRYEVWWAKGVRLPQAKEWSQAHLFIRQALVLEPRHPDYLQFLGRLHSWSYFVEDDKSEKPSVDEGLVAHRQALNVRPYWAYGWAELALLKSQSGRIDDEYRHAFSQALKFGYWERQVLLNLFNASLGSWDSLSFAEREELVNLFYRGAMFESETASGMISIAASHGVRPIFCQMISRYPSQTYLDATCNKPS